MPAGSRSSQANVEANREAARSSDSSSSDVSPRPEYSSHFVNKTRRPSKGSRRRLPAQEMETGRMIDEDSGREFGEPPGR